MTLFACEEKRKMQCREAGAAIRRASAASSARWRRWSASIAAMPRGTRNCALRVTNCLTMPCSVFRAARMVSGSPTASTVPFIVTVPRCASGCAASCAMPGRACCGIIPWPHCGICCGCDDAVPPCSARAAQHCGMKTYGRQKRKSNECPASAARFVCSCRRRRF